MSDLPPVLTLAATTKTRVLQTKIKESITVGGKPSHLKPTKQDLLLMF